MKSTISFKRKIALIISGLFLSIVLLEIGLRIGGFVYSFPQKYRNWLSLMQEGRYRILCLGESTTFNQYPHLLEKILNQQNIGIKFSVIDKGGGAANTGIILTQ